MYFKPIWGTLFLKYSGGALVSFRAAICVACENSLYFAAPINITSHKEESAIRVTTFHTDDVGATGFWSRVMIGLFYNLI
jgi:hypothetical protein